MVIFGIPIDLQESLRSRHAPGADEDDQVPFEKYAKAANGLLKPSSAARAIDGGAEQIERVDLLVKLIADQMGQPMEEADETADIINARLEENRKKAA